MLIGSSRNY